MFPIHKLIICPQNKTFCTARFSDSGGGSPYRHPPGQRPPGKNMGPETETPPNKADRKEVTYREPPPLKNRRLWNYYPKLRLRAVKNNRYMSR